MKNCGNASEIVGNGMQTITPINAIRIVVARCFGIFSAIRASFTRGPKCWVRISNVLADDARALVLFVDGDDGGHLVFEADEKSMARRRAFVFERTYVVLADLGTISMQFKRENQHTRCDSE